MISMSIFLGGSPAFSALPDVHADGHDAKTGMRQVEGEDVDRRSLYVKQKT